MSGETDLDDLIRSMSPELVQGLFVFVSVPSDRRIDDVQPRMTFMEAEGMTYILLQSEAESLGLTYEFPCRMITLNIHSSLEAVGFMARIATALAQHDMGVNPVSGFYHDHLFVPDGCEETALTVLRALAKS